MPHRDPPEPVSAEALQALSESAEHEIEELFARFSIAPADQEPLLHGCLVRLGLEWEELENDPKLWLLSELEADCGRWTAPPPGPNRPGETEGGAGGGGHQG